MTMLEPCVWEGKKECNGIVLKLHLLLEIALGFNTKRREQKKF